MWQHTSSIIHALKCNREVWTAGGKDISNDSLGSLGIDGHVTSRIVLKRQTKYKTTFPFTVHREKIRQAGQVSSTGTGGGATIHFQSPNGSLELANARADDRVWGMSLSIWKTRGRVELCASIRLPAMPFTVGNMDWPAFSASQKEREKWRKWMLCIHFLKEWHIEQGPKTELR